MPVLVGVLLVAVLSCALAVLAAVLVVLRRLKVAGSGATPARPAAGSPAADSAAAPAAVSGAALGATPATGRDGGSGGDAVARPLQQSGTDRQLAEQEQLRRQGEVDAGHVLGRAQQQARELTDRAREDAAQAVRRAQADVAQAVRRAQADAEEITRVAQKRAAETLRAAEATSAQRVQAAEHAAAQLRRAGEAAAVAVEQLRATAERDLLARKGELHAVRAELDRREHRVAEREKRLDTALESLERRSEGLAAAEAGLAERAAAVQDLEAQRRRVLERAACLTGEQAKAELVRAVEQEAKREAAVRVRQLEAEARAEAESRARSIITYAVQRLASEQTAESVVTVVALPGDEMKGRIIGREGRNIRTFEAVTGVNVIIDETPEAVVLSCFDPVRREVARVALEALVLDGRISPHRIEEVVERSRVEVEALGVRAGEEALIEVGLTDVHPELVAVLGRLRLRTSYGQNVLKHLVECAHLAGMMADELGLDAELAKRCALMHDLGKALTHEVSGSHALLGAELARKYGERDEVVHAIEAHHNEVEPRTVEAVLTQAADAISGGRPGARRESAQAYVQRLERLEEIAGAHDGVEKVYAMQAGRELRVMVVPEAVDDLQAQVIARDIAKQVEEELTYPGQIRITVVRESRAVETAR